MLRNYIKIAWKNILKYKIFSLFNILGLSIGLTSCIVIFAVSRHELDFDSFHPDKERIFRLVSEIKQNNGTLDHWADVPDPTPMQLRKEITGAEKIAAFHNYNAKVTIPEGNEVKRSFPMPKQEERIADIIITEPEYFDILKYEWIAGSPYTSLKEPFSVVLTTSEARKYFGTDNPVEVVGKRVIYNDSLSVSVTGLVKDFTRNTDFTFKDFISFSTVPHSFLRQEIHLEEWGGFNSASQTILKLQAGTSASRVEAQFPAFARQHILLNKGQQIRMVLQPLKDMHFNSDYRTDYGHTIHLPTLYALMGVAVFLLVIGAINFVNLAISQSIPRSKEIGIRKVLGSSRKRILVQFMSETLLLVLVAMVISVLLVYPVLSSFPAYIPSGVTFNPLDPVNGAFLLLTILITAFVAGFYPAMVLSAFSPSRNLRVNTTIRSSATARLRKALIIFQLAVSVIFIAGSVIVGSQLSFMINKDMGFSKDAILTINTDRQGPPEKRHLLAAELRRLPSVKAVSLDWLTPATGGAATTTIKYDGYKEPILTDVHIRVADENYIPLFQIRLLAGRNILHSDTLNEFVINETYSRILKFKTPQEAVGHVLDLWGKNVPIVGVVKDFNLQALSQSIMPVIIASNDPSAINLSVKLMTYGKKEKDLTASLAEVALLWKTIYPEKEFEYSFFDDTISNFYEKEKRTAQIINAAMIIAIFITCLGLSSLVAFTVEQKAKEIGIRKAMGASVGMIIIMLLKDFMKLVVIAIVIALPVAFYFINKWMNNFAYRIDSIWTGLLLSALGVILVSLLTMSLQVIKAAVANPIRILRAE